MLNSGVQRFIKKKKKEKSCFRTSCSKAKYFEQSTKIVHFFSFLSFCFFCRCYKTLQGLGFTVQGCKGGVYRRQRIHTFKISCQIKQFYSTKYCLGRCIHSPGKAFQKRKISYKREKKLTSLLMFSPVQH